MNLYFIKKILQHVLKLKKNTQLGEKTDFIAFTATQHTEHSLFLIIR